MSKGWISKGPRGRHPADPTGEAFGDEHWPLPEQYNSTPITQVVIDRASMVFIATGEYRTIWARATEEYRLPSEAVVIGPLDKARTFSKFTDMELRMLYRNSTGHSYEGDDYNALLQACRTLAGQIEVTPTNPAIMGRVAPEVAPIPRSEKPVTKKSEAAPTQGLRPKAGSVTGRVWEIGDEVLAAMPNAGIKEIRAEIIRRGVEAGINQATVQTQYGKWKGTKNF